MHPPEVRSRLYCCVCSSPESISYLNRPSLPSSVPGRGINSGLSLRRTTATRSHPGEQSTDPPARAVERMARRLAKRGRRNLPGAHGPYSLGIHTYVIVHT